MTINKLASLIAKKEGKKHQASIGDIREILGILSDEIYEADSVLDILCLLIDTGLKREKRHLKRLKKSSKECQYCKHEGLD